MAKIKKAVPRGPQNFPFFSDFYQCDKCGGTGRVKIGATPRSVMHAVCDKCLEGNILVRWESTIDKQNKVTGFKITHNNTEKYFPVSFSITILQAFRKAEVYFSKLKI